MNARVRTWAKRVGIGLAASLVLVGVFIGWLLNSASGMRFALARAEAALHGKLSVAQARGTLAGPLQLHAVRYRDAAAGIDLRIDNLDVNWSLWRLLGAGLHVRDLRVDGVDVRLSKPTARAAAQPPGSVSSAQALLTPPLAIAVDSARITKLSVMQDGNPVFAADRLELAATWTTSALAIRRLALRSPNGRLDFDGRLGPYRHYRGHARATFDWRSADRRVAGGLTFDGDGRSIALSLKLTQPVPATAELTLATAVDLRPWTLKLDVPRFDPGALGIDNRLKALAVDLRGHGDRQEGQLDGRILANQFPLRLDPLRFALSGQRLNVRQLRLRVGDEAGVLNASGQVRLDAAPPTVRFDADWNGIKLPADLVGYTLASHGTVHAEGNVDRYAAQGELALGPPGHLADVAFQLDGSAQRILARRLELKQPDGGLTATGSVTLQPHTGWTLDAQATHLDPAAFAAGWPGAVDFTLHSSGTLDDAGVRGHLGLTGLGGTLRGQALHGGGELTLAPPLSIGGKLNLAVGTSTVSLHGNTGTAADLHVNLAIARLGDWLPDAVGALHGDIDVKGAWPELDVDGKVDASNLGTHGIRAQTLGLRANVKRLPANPGGRIGLDAKQFVLADRRFDTFALAAHGDASALSATLAADGPVLAVKAALSGGATAAAKGMHDWHASLSRLELTAKKRPHWTLQQPVALRYADGDFQLGQLCLTAAPSQLCLSAARHAGTAHAEFKLRQLPLATIADLTAPDSALHYTGAIDASGTLTGSGGTTEAHATIRSDHGAVVYTETPDRPLAGYSDLRADAAWHAGHGNVSIHAALDHGGRVDGDVTLGSAAAGLPLSGRIAADVHDLAFVDLIGEQTAATRGRLSMNLAVSGTGSAPEVAGELTLTDFSSEVPAAGLKLHDGRLTLRSGDGRRFVVDGTIGSDKGTVAITGTLGLTAHDPLQLHVAGEDFLAADIPGARVHVSPDLTLVRQDGAYTLNGSVVIPRADVDLGELPGGSAAAASPDVVVTDATARSAAAGPRLNADISVKLGAGRKLDMDLRQGREVHLVGDGLNGYLQGQLTILEKAGKTTTGRGQIVVDGTYKAYGQDLKIEQGRLLFAGTPVDDPGLDIRATRSGFADPNVSVGLQVRGTAQHPLLSVFSNPAMEQSDALSYLVTGKPLSQLRNGEGDAVGNAARALGTAGGDLLSKRIGNRLGLDDVGVSDNSAVGGAALTIGKYLSPRLYLSYGVGLFTPGEVVTLRYRLSRLFNLVIRNGTLSSRAGINYRIEK